jgi:hypothetical protein
MKWNNSEVGYRPMECVIYFLLTRAAHIGTLLPIMKYVWSPGSGALPVYHIQIVELISAVVTCVHMLFALRITKLPQSPHMTPRTYTTNPEPIGINLPNRFLPILTPPLTFTQTLWPPSVLQLPPLWL